MILRDDVLQDGAASINPAWFYRPAHAEIFNALAAMAAANMAVDLVTLRDHPGDRLEDIGGIQYLADLVKGVPNADSLEHYAKIIEGKYTRRRLIMAANEISASAYSEDTEVFDVVGAAFESVQAAGTIETDDRQVSGGDAMQGMIDRVVAVRAGEVTSALPTGFPMLDAMLDGNGMQDGDLVVLAARPKIGKSIVKGDIVRNVAATGCGVLDISGEMRRSELMKRHAGAMTSILTSRISKATKLTEEDMDLLRDAQREMDSWQYQIIDQPMTIPMIAAAAKRQNSLWDGNLKLVTIDYLHLMIPDGSGQGREQQVGLMMRQCKMAAQAMGVPWLVLSQFNRGAADGRPEPNQFRDSGQIEEHANTAIILDRADEATHGVGDPAGPFSHLLLSVALQRSGVMPGWASPVSRKLRYCCTRTETLDGTEIS